MVVDAQVDEPVAAAPVAAALADDEQRRRLATAAVTAGRLAGRERGQQALGQRPSGGRLERLGKGVDRGFVRRGCSPVRRSRRPYAAGPGDGSQIR